MLPDDRIPDCRDQGENRICVAMAITAVLQIIYYIKTGIRKQFSPSWGAAVWRKDPQEQKNMKSLNPDSALPALIEKGAVFTKDLPELLENPKAYEYVSTHPGLWGKTVKLVCGFEKINDGDKDKRIRRVKEALMNNLLPVIADMRDKPENHCVPIIGWDDDAGVFKVMNSFGDKGGAKGIDSYKYADFKRGYLLIPSGFEKEETEEREMENSMLADYVKISPNKTSPRNHKIDTITIHCVVGQLSAEGIASCFSSPSRKASCNYGIGYDGKIALIVDEGDRSWCSSNKENDHRAITIEVASDKVHPYKVTDEAYDALIDLLVDICERNGIKKLLWRGDKTLVGQVDKQNMTVHRWFKNKACPGDYLYNKHAEIAEEVNRRLSKDKFTDIENHWARDIINILAEKRIVTGRGDGTFDPDGKITRAEVAVMIARALNLC